MATRFSQAQRELEATIASLGATLDAKRGQRSVLMALPENMGRMPFKLIVNDGMTKTQDNVIRLKERGLVDFSWRYQHALALMPRSMWRPKEVWLTPAGAELKRDAMDLEAVARYNMLRRQPSSQA